MNGNPYRSNIYGLNSGARQFPGLVKTRIINWEEILMTKSRAEAILDYPDKAKAEWIKKKDEVTQALKEKLSQ